VPLSRGGFIHGTGGCSRLPERSVTVNSLPRRKLLAGGAGLAASAALVIPGLSKATAADADPAATVTVRWNAATKTWAKRPADAEFGVVFLSTNDPAATPPTDSRVQAGDVWRTHPDAQHEAISQHHAVSGSAA
jgi:hypothetical protein